MYFFKFKINNDNKDNWEINNIITKKSTTLDFLEREKSIDRICYLVNISRDKCI
jgi:hypothetical protein